MKMHAIGSDISPFNCLIARVKTAKYDIAKARAEILEVEKRVRQFSKYFVRSDEVSAIQQFMDDLRVSRRKPDKPNIDEIVGFKRKMLERVAIRGAVKPKPKIFTGLAIPYNPYFGEENFKH